MSKSWKNFFPYKKGEKRKTKQRALLKLIVIVCFFSGSLLSYWPDYFYNQVFADEVSDQFEQNIEEIKKRIENTNIRLDGTITEKVTLQQVIAELNAEIGNLQTIIGQTQAEINRLQTEIESLRVEIEAQKAILERILVLLYQRSGVSSFELIITSETFSDYLDDQEYLDRLGEGVGTSVKQIQDLQIELQIDEAHQTKLLEDQKAQEIALQGVRWEQQELLRQTLNQEQVFQQQLAQLQTEQQQLERELEDYLASLLITRVSLGRVSAGDVIGKNGNTGWSTGPHLHMTIYNLNGIKYDPLSFIQNNGLLWPMGGSGGWVSQGFHAGHQALDIAAAEGVPIRAVADGNIIHRGCLLSSNPKFIAYAVIIDHGDYVSFYAHLQAPNNPKYEVCSINRRNSYGAKSVDYSTTE